MNRLGRVEEDYTGASSSHLAMASTVHVPHPMEGLHDSGPPPFLTKTYDIVEDLNTNHIISWSRGNNSFVVWDPQSFSMTLLPRYFKHNNFSSFVRQLNTYGFRKVDPDRWEFANEGFLRGQKHLLKNIRRRKTSQFQPSSQQQSLDPCVEVGRFGIEAEIDRLRRDKQVLMLELVKLRQQQQTAKSCLQLMEQRLKRTETKQQHMMNFLARAIQNPNFMQQLVQKKDKRKELEVAICKKRRRQIDQGPSNMMNYDNAIGVESFVKNEPEEFGDISEFQVPEFDTMAMNMNIQGVSSEGEVQNLEEEYIENIGIESTSKERLEDRFWDDLLNENIGEGTGMFDDGVEDVDVLVEQLSYLGSSPS